MFKLLLTLDFKQHLYGMHVQGMRIEYMDVI